MKAKGQRENLEEERQTREGGFDVGIEESGGADGPPHHMGKGEEDKSPQPPSERLVFFVDLGFRNRRTPSLVSYL